MLNFWDFIQVYVFSANHHLNFMVLWHMLHGDAQNFSAYPRTVCIIIIKKHSYPT